ncbi:hypothetical protein N7388_06115 [Stutzerimonas stutzeri]|uniref:hypothetical protein n=1 Tax=Stutzerimonas stutzeri TaxID=316 RepID=UPI002448957F|nr:hypothetical protein [Stutzerimonas stutzeri]MDH0443256.1 hypothetical protein [Stutzerimonas stutzeri]
MHQRVAGDTGGGGDGCRQGALDIVADGIDIRRQRLVEQVALGEALDSRGIHQDDDQQARQ